MLQSLYVVTHYLRLHAITHDERELLLILELCRVNEEVIIRLKWGQTEYKGRLVSIDSYMNIQLSGAEEYIDQQMTSALGQVLIRYVWVFQRSGGGRDELAAARSLRMAGRIMLKFGTGVIMSYGSKPQIKTTETRTRRWKDERMREGLVKDTIEILIGVGLGACE
jgi:small nuclear ribonucleoprotein (snRNP)-like protein